MGQFGGINKTFSYKRWGREKEINVCGECAVGEQFRGKLVIGD